MNDGQEWSAQVTEQVNQMIRPGQRFLGAVNGSGVVELVFDRPDSHEYNLITVDPKNGILVGGVADPESYVDPERTWKV
jgi:hypothetical protein